MHKPLMSYNEDERPLEQLGGRRPEICTIEMNTVQARIIVQGLRSAQGKGGGSHGVSTLNKD